MTNSALRGKLFAMPAIVESLWLLLPAAVFFLVAVSTWPSTSKCHPDLGLYFHASDRIVQGDLPYRDFRFEYPPLALVACLTPLLFGWGDRDLETFRWGFLFANSVYLTVIAWTARAVSRREKPERELPLWSLTLGAGLLAHFLAWRYDLFPTMLVALAFLAASRDRPLLCGGLLGLGISAKIYPLVLVPVFALWFVRRCGWKSGFLVGFSTLASLGLTILPFLPDGISGLLRVLTFHSQRGIHVESTSGGLILLTNFLVGIKTPVGVSYGAWHIHASAADALAPLHGLLFLVLYGLFAVLAIHRIFRKRGELPAQSELAVLCFGATLVFVLTNKVFSPQFLAWFLPFLSFLRTRQIILFLGACALGIILFPFGYDALLRGDLWAILVLDLRNLLLAGLLLTCIAAEHVPASTAIREQSCEA